VGNMNLLYGVMSARVHSFRHQEMRLEWQTFIQTSEIYKNEIPSRSIVFLAK
jgi:hypothetical protein